MEIGHPRLPVFVSYAHVDNEPPDKWLDRFLEMLKPLSLNNMVCAWSDKGDPWTTPRVKMTATRWSSRRRDRRARQSRSQRFGAMLNSVRCGDRCVRAGCG